jgi:formyl-CoA transferase/CoA:oxalate CoA-transferase
MWAALGVVAALHERERTGSAPEVDVSLYETAFGYVGYHLAGYLADGTVPSGEGTRFPMVAPYQVFTTGDGELMIAAGNDRLFAALCDVIGAPSLVDDPRFRRNPDRVTNRDALGALLEQRLRSAPAAVWHERLTAAGVPAAQVADVGEIARAPQTEALGLLQSLPHPAIPDLRLPALPLSLDHERALHRMPPPTVGQHTAEVLGEAGYDDDTIAALAARGVINA